MDEYIINKKVIFNVQEGLLYQIDDKSRIETLSPPLTNLLHYLISHRDKIFTKESIAEIVLEKNNRSPSTNNINNYLSLLRKSLRNVQIEDAFITIPKVGIRFVADISSYEEVMPPYPNKIKSKFFYLIAIIIIFVSFTFFIFFDKENYLNGYIILYQDSSCTIYTKKPVPFYLENTSSYCKYGNEIFLFHKKNSPNNVHFSDRYLIVACQRGGVNCENHTKIY